MTQQSSRERVFVVTATFPPDGAVGSLRTLRLLKQLARNGSDVEVLTLAPESYRPGAVRDPALLAHVPDAVGVTRAQALRPVERLGALLRRTRTTASVVPSSAVTPSVANNDQAVWRRSCRRLQQACSAALALPDREVSWILPVLIAGWRASRVGGRPNIIYSSGPPYSAHLAAAGLALILRRPWVADFRDPWARAPWREDRFAFEKRAWSVLERLVVSRASAVVFVTNGNKAEFTAHYGEEQAKRFHLVPNGCDSADFGGLLPRPSERFVLLHAGSLYGARDPSPLFRAIARAIGAGTIIDPDRFRLRLIGRLGGEAVNLRALTRDLGIEAFVEFVPHMPRRMVLQEMLDASALLIVQPVTKVSVPGKLYEYLATGRPVLALAEPDGDTAMLVRQSGAGVAVSPGDQPAIERALTSLINGGHLGGTVDPAWYDGAVRAAELAALLRTVRSVGEPSGATSQPASASTRRR